MTTIGIHHHMGIQAAAVDARAAIYAASSAIRSQADRAMAAREVSVCRQAFKDLAREYRKWLATIEHRYLIRAQDVLAGEPGTALTDYPVGVALARLNGARTHTERAAHVDHSTAVPTVRLDTARLLRVILLTKATEREMQTAWDWYAHCCQLFADRLRELGETAPDWRVVS